MNKLRYVSLSLTLLLTLAAGFAGAEEKEEGWISLFDGKSLDGWKINENPESWKVEDGAIVAQGERSHLFYTGRDFKNFEFTCDVQTTPGSNGGIFFHTRFQEEGWPAHGYESQVNNTHRDPVKTGSIYNTVKLFQSAAQDDKWWTQKITVQGKRVTVEIDGKKVIDYVEPDDKEGTVKLSEGAFALQAHDPKSVIRYKNIAVRPLP